MSMSFLSLPAFLPELAQLTHANPKIAEIPFALMAISQRANCSQTNLGVFEEKSCTSRQSSKMSLGVFLFCSFYLSENVR